MKARQFTVLLLLLTVVQVHGQVNLTEETMAVIERKTDVDMKNIYQKVKRYDYNPRYLIDFSSTDCTYEIFINGVSAVKITGPGTVGGQ